jgi:hypothetical protein
MFREFAALNDKPSVLLLDRAVMDQKVFASSLDIWESVLRENSTTEEEILKSYDAVVHLGTCAQVGNYEWGPGSNNPGRYHSPEEAATLDATCERVYQNHKQFRKVPHCSSFEEKVEQVMKYLEDALGVDGLAGRRQRVKVKVADIPADVLSRSQAYVITSTFLDARMHLSVRRRQRIQADRWCESLASENRPTQPWKAAHGEGDTTFEERRSIPDDCYLARRVLTETAYYTEVGLAPKEGIDKYVLSFQIGAGLHFELFYFQGSGDSAIIVDFPVGANLPTWIERAAKSKVQAHPSGPPSPGPPSKVARTLKKNSTEEAAQIHHDRKEISELMEA